MNANTEKYSIKHMRAIVVKFLLPSRGRFMVRQKYSKKEETLI